MSVFLQATLEIRAGEFARFCQTMKEILPIVEGEGWKLDGAYVQRTGRLHTVIDLWELEDFNHFDRGVQAIATHARGTALQAALADTVISETVVFATKAPYMRS
jgi:tRNA(Leu) C34 or U34 (ribose-2'-O)-methylase TrmL